MLQKIGEIIGIDRTDFIELVNETKQHEITRSWTAKGIEHHSRVPAKTYYPWLIERVRCGEKYIHFSSLEDLPVDATQDKESLENMGIKTGLIIPYATGGPDYGAICFGSHRKITWTEEHIQRLRLLGEVIVNAFRRQALKKAHGELEELVNEKTYEIKLTQKTSIRALAVLSEYYDFDTGEHLNRIQEYVRLIATELMSHSSYSKYLIERQGYINDIVLASVLHDIGKVAIPAEIFLCPVEIFEIQHLFCFSFYERFFQVEVCIR